MNVVMHASAAEKLLRLPTREQVAMHHAIEKLEALGEMLAYPHSSAVKGANLRELRPRRGDSPWRAFYRRSASTMVIGSIGPEARVDPRGFAAAVAIAKVRIEEIESR